VTGPLNAPNAPNYSWTKGYRSLYSRPPMASLNPQIFREYDIRGLVGSDLTPETVELLGKGLGTLARRAAGAGSTAKPIIAVGRDARESSGPFRDALARGLNSTGCDVIDVGLIPTPLLYFAANTLPVDGGAMITGSHNPPEYNGFKVGLGKTTFHGSEIQGLRVLIERGDFAHGSGGMKERPILADYIDYVARNLELGPRRPRLVIDAGNGVGGLASVPLFERMGFEVTGLFLEPDGRFPNHHPDPTIEANVRALQQKVLEVHADLGIAYDGDADRVGIVDDQGKILWGDQIMILLSRAVLKEVPGATIIADVKCSMALFDDIAKHGGKPIIWKTGHSIIKAKIRETHAALAGEMSGHIFFAQRWFGFDDGIYASARLVELLTHSSEPVSRLLEDVPRTHATPEIHIASTEEAKFALVDEVKRHFATGKDPIVDVDGVRVTFPDGWGLVRASNTQPILVLRFEAKTEPRLREIQGLFEEAVRAAQRKLGA
jgi:phosphomannomutase / phosphoglucomutase